MKAKKLCHLLVASHIPIPPIYLHAKVLRQKDNYTFIFHYCKTGGLL